MKQPTIIMLISFSLFAYLMMDNHRNLIDQWETNVDAGSSIGRTHFIVGQDYSEQRALAQESIKKPATSPCFCDQKDLDCLLRCPDGSVKHVLFSPDDNIQQAALHLIANEKERIRVAIYSFTDAKIAQALLDADARGVAIEMVVDSSCTHDRFGKLSLLEKSGIAIHVYSPKSKALLSDIMHNKVMLLYKNVMDKSLIWTGSFNFTQSANKKNQENVVILDDAYVFQKYEKQFDTLKKRCK